MTSWTDDELKAVKYPSYDALTEKLARWLLEQREVSRKLELRVSALKDDVLMMTGQLDSARESYKRSETKCAALAQGWEDANRQVEAMRKVVEAAKRLDQNYVNWGNLGLAGIAMQDALTEMAALELSKHEKRTTGTSIFNTPPLEEGPVELSWTPNAPTVKRDNEKAGRCGRCGRPGICICRTDASIPVPPEFFGGDKRNDTSPTERPCCVDAYARGYSVGHHHGRCLPNSVGSPAICGWCAGTGVEEGSAAKCPKCYGVGGRVS